MNANSIINTVKMLITTYGFNLVIGLIFLFIGWKIINKIVKGFDKVLNKRNVDSTLRSFLHSLIDISLKILLVISLIDFVGIPTTSFAAIVASAGLAVGLALQGSLSNFAGGVIILLIRPFKVGDFIEAAGFSGTVEGIKIFYTHLVTPDNKEILIPNGTLANGSVVNYSAKATRRVDLQFGVGYEDDIIKVRRILLDLINKHDKILQTPEPFVALSEHADSSVNFVVRVWCNSEDYWTVYFDLLEQVKIKFDEEGINIPYPQMDVHLKQN